MLVIDKVWWGEARPQNLIIYHYILSSIDTAPLLVPIKQKLCSFLVRLQQYFEILTKRNLLSVVEIFNKSLQSPKFSNFVMLQFSYYRTFTKFNFPYLFECCEHKMSPSIIGIHHRRPNQGSWTWTKWTLNDQHRSIDTEYHSVECCWVKSKCFLHSVPRKQAAWPNLHTSYIDDIGKLKASHFWGLIFGR